MGRRMVDFGSRRMIISLIGFVGTGELSLTDRKSTLLNSSHTDIYTLSLHDALPIYIIAIKLNGETDGRLRFQAHDHIAHRVRWDRGTISHRSEEHTSELQSH